MQDMLKQDLKVGDTVAYVYVNDNGKVSTITGKIEALGKVRTTILTPKGTLKVQNVIKLKKEVQKTVANRISLFEAFKQRFLH